MRTLVIRHGKKDPEGILTAEGREEAGKLGGYLRSAGLHTAIVAPTERAFSTAAAAGLRVINLEESLMIPEEFETYLNNEVVTRMFNQPGNPWEKSYTKEIVQDVHFETDFKEWGRRLLEVARRSIGTVLIGSSPLVELAYLSVKGSVDWRLIPRCKELEGFWIQENENVELFTRETFL